MAQKFTSSFTNEEKEMYMREALGEARLAFEQEEVPIGCVIVHNGNIIARGSNVRELTQDATTHAEMNAIRFANHSLSSFRLENSALFVTVEPCVMCAGAILLSRIPEVYYGSANAKGGACGSVVDVMDIPAINHAPFVEGGILQEECGRIMTEFFQDKRAKKRNDTPK
ncbi:tRNA(adenine34) deaminase [Pilibacter termitis]|uniref:tRNA-specific adenosine deaminase n=1 Tax=Pilibacter termitis TaxID=263852 RepID=A0A1T4QGK3_9ENTE|nr:tRNA adenosine(34) deaminase TadA [Pilibacter termitis]SKA02822.1 tRNA(adenine34) deaminase [Pilibacter termitis]